MKNNMLFLVFFCYVSIMSFAQPVIINDTGDWHGEIQADEHGFFIYNTGMWCQRGANFKDENILTFADDFSPEISSSGLNTVTCTYADIGWIWPTSGKSVSDSISFYTSNLVSDTELVENRRSVSINNHQSIGAIATSPASVSYTTSYSITASTTTETAYSTSITGQNTLSVTGTLMNIVSLGHSISNSLTLAIENKLGITTGEEYSNAITLTSGPINFDSSQYRAHVEFYFTAFRNKYRISYYNDSDHNGLCNASDLTDILVNYYYNPVPCIEIILVELAD